MGRFYASSGCLIFGLILVGCAAQAVAPVPTPTPEFALALTPIPGASLPATTPLAPPPTLTSEPTSTPTETVAPTPVNTPTPTWISPIPLPPYPAPTDTLPLDVATLESPDGRWRAATTYSSHWSPDEVLFTLTDVATNQVTVLEHLSATPETPISYVPVSLAWAIDSESLFFTYRPYFADGCGGQLDSTLHAYDVSAGEHLLLIDRAGGNITFSPDRQRVVYFPYLDGDAPQTLSVFDVESGILRVVPLDASMIAQPLEMEIGAEVFWHPDDRRVVLSLDFNYCVDRRTALVVVDTATMHQSVIKTGEIGYSFEGWEDDQWLAMRRDDDTFWKLNIDTGELTPRS